MNTTIQALQALYVKLGGSLTDTYSTIANGVPVSDYTTIPDMIEACTQKAGSGGGSALPAVTAEDNGSVLTVVEGAWDKATGSGGSALPAVTAEDNGSVLTVVEGAWDKATGSGVFYVEYSTTGGTTWTTETDFNDIIAAYESGKTVKARATIENITLLAELTSVSSSELVFCHINAESNYIEVTKFTHSSSDVITVLNKQIT